MHYEIGKLISLLETQISSPDPRSKALLETQISSPDPRSKALTPDPFVNPEVTTTLHSSEVQDQAVPVELGLSFVSSLRQTVLEVLIGSCYPLSSEQ